MTQLAIVDIEPHLRCDRTTALSIAWVAQKSAIWADLLIDLS